MRKNKNQPVANPLDEVEYCHVAEVIIRLLQVLDNIVEDSFKVRKAHDHTNRQEGFDDFGLCRIYL